MTASAKQEVLVQPTRHDDELTSEWRSRYTSAYNALFAHLLALPAVRDADSHAWAGEPNVIIFRTSGASLAPAFQFDANGDPIKLVQTVNFRLGLRYRDGRVPWGRPNVAKLVWWLQIHPELGEAPIDLLGTDREFDLVVLATDMDSLR